MPDDAAMVTAFLADRHVACPACGYDLHGAAAPVCPECGRGLGLHITPVTDSDPRFRRTFQVGGLALLVNGSAQLLTHGIDIALGRIVVAMHWTMWVSLVWSIISVGVGVAVLRASRKGGYSPKRVLLASNWLVGWLVLGAMYSVGWAIYYTPWFLILP